MLISVLITCYNLSSYISECIESVLAQTLHPSFFEIIVVDDCSIDNSVDVISRYDVNLVRSRSNRGVLGAMLLGLDNCSGDIICFLDGDDTWHSDKLRYVYERFLRDRELIFLTHGYQFVDSTGSRVNGLQWTQERYKGMSDSQISKEIKEGILNRSNYVWLGSAFSLRRNKEVFASFAAWSYALPNLRCTYQDWTIAYWVAVTCDGNYGYIDEVLLNYRIHSSNYSGDRSSSAVAIRNWSKALYTSLALFDICIRHGAGGSCLQICHERLLYDFLVSQALADPRSVSVASLVKIILLRVSFLTKSKEVARLVLLRLLGARKTYDLFRVLNL